MTDYTSPSWDAEGLLLVPDGPLGKGATPQRPRCFAQLQAWGQDAQQPLARDRRMSQIASTTSATTTAAATRSAGFEKFIAIPPSSDYAMPIAWPMSRATNATTHAMTSMPTPTRMAQPVPSSRLIAAMAATHGV